MRTARSIIFIFVFCLLAHSAVAGEVRVFKPKEEDISPMALRKEAMAEGFGQAVLEDALAMLPGELGEVRTELLKQYFVENAQPYILGYKILYSQDMDAGLILRLDVKVNKRTLRAGLKRMGLFSTIKTPLPASVVWPEDLDEEALLKLQGLVTLTGLQVTADTSPSFTFDPGPEKTYKARLVLDDREWVAMNKDMSVAWFELWAKYFTRSEVVASQASTQLLVINGWFSPDGVLEFDRVLRSWDSAVQEVQLIEMDMQPAGVGASWDVRILSSERLSRMLQGYLPQRGLSYQLSEDTEK